MSQETDANNTRDIIREYKSDWILVDHYSLDETWHRKIKKLCKNIMVIDDLGDRSLDCKLLLDQNLGVSKEKYEGKIPFNCKSLFEPIYALLRASQKLRSDFVG